MRKEIITKSLVALLSVSLIYPGVAPVMAISQDPEIEPKEAAYGYYVDVYTANEKNNTTITSNPSLGVLSNFLDIYQKGTTLTNGTIVNETLHNENIQKAKTIANARNQEDYRVSYVKDRRNQNYSMIEGLGPYAKAFIELANAKTDIGEEIPADAKNKVYSDQALWADSNSKLGNMVSLVEAIRGTGASTSSAKDFYYYARPHAWLTASGEADIRLDELQILKTDAELQKDGGFPSGHTNAAYLASYALAYATPQRFTELLTCASDLGNSRIVAGMHSPLDVMGGRVMATAVAAAALNDPKNKDVKNAAYQEAQEILLTSTSSTEDSYDNYQINKDDYEARLTYGFEQTGETSKDMTVPKGAEVLLETRLPYLDATQRRYVLYTTGLASGYPILDDEEGWGRLNLFAAANGYGSFVKDVTVDMDASLGGFNAEDTWMNDIDGVGGLIKQGTGTLNLAGTNSYQGDTTLTSGKLVAKNANALGNSNINNVSGVLSEEVNGKVIVNQDLVQEKDGVLELNIGSKQDLLEVKGSIDLEGKLVINFTDNFVPDDSMALISFKGNQGINLEKIEINGLPKNYSSIIKLENNKIMIVDANKIDIPQNNVITPIIPKTTAVKTGDDMIAVESVQLMILTMGLYIFIKTKRIF